MLLRSVRIGNFRALTSAAIQFDPTTVLIGENDCGRSSILEALAIVLGWNAADGEFRFQSFHLHRSARHTGQALPPISVALEFAESFDGEWDGPAFEILHAILPGHHAKRRLDLEVTHDPATGTRWTFHSPGGGSTRNDGAMLKWLRGRMPVVWLSEGMMGGKAVAKPLDPLDGTTNALAGEVRTYHKNLLGGRVPDVAAAIDAGAAAARQLLHARSDLLTDEVGSLGAVLQEITGKKRPRSTTLPKPVPDSGMAAQKLGLLLVVGALLRSRETRIQHGMDPLTIIENPEAHLHPVTLASVWRIIEQVAGQKIVATHSAMLLASARLASVRRLTRRDGVVRAWSVPEGALDADELRRYSYHLRSRRATASFARCWLLVEGETEFWLMGELARLCGYDFASEAVACVEFAQCGLGALIKVARHLGIAWHLLSDGDRAGQIYARAAGGVGAHVTLLKEPDMEHCFWKYGFADVFYKAAFPNPSTAPGKVTPNAVIKRAIERHSKPNLAIRLLDALIDRGPAAVPPPLRNVIETCIRLARGDAARRAAAGPGDFSTPA